MELIPSKAVELFCLLTHNNVPHTSWHDLRFRRTTKKYSVFAGLVVFSYCSCGNSGSKHGSVIVNNIFACFTLSLSALQVNMIKG